jgi:hypothetical protein
MKNLTTMPALFPTPASRPGSWNWILSKLTTALMVAVAIVIFARVVSYLLVENISMSTFDNIAISLLKTFLNESQYQTVVNNAKIAGASKHSEIVASPSKSVKDLLPESTEPSNGEQECAVCKYVIPPLVRCAPVL